MERERSTRVSRSAGTARASTFTGMPLANAEDSARVVSAPPHELSSPSSTAGSITITRAGARMPTSDQQRNKQPAGVKNTTARYSKRAASSMLIAHRAIINDPGSACVSAAVLYRSRLRLVSNRAALCVLINRA